MFSHQPKPFPILFMVGMWESFSIYGLRALFTLYLASELLIGDHNAYGVYGAFGALLYSLPFLGGLISDRGLGLRRSIIMGSLIMIAGFTVLLLPMQNAFYGGIGIIICGYAFFKPNITSLLGKLYQDKDPRRDSGFSLFFVASNLGGLIAPLVCGYVAYAYNWSYAFALTSLGMTVGLLTFLKGARLFRPYDQNIQNQKFKKLGHLNVRHLIYLGLFPLIYILPFLMSHSEWMNLLMPLSFGLVMIWILRLALRNPPQERANILTLLVLLRFVLVFDVCFEQAWSSLNFLVERAVARTFKGFEIPPAWFLGINPFLVVILGPLFSSLWLKLEYHKYHLSVDLKFMIGLFTLTLGFIALYVGTQLPDPCGLINPLWVFLGHTFHTIGELCIIPVGISMVSKLAPKNYKSTFMGFWLFIWAFSHYLGGHVARLTTFTTVEAAGDLWKCRAIYSDIFWYIIIILLCLCLVLWIIRPYLRSTLKRVEG
jgi:POT family proton-dependent oligopeptide transporter